MRLPSLNEYIRVCRTNKYAGAQFKAEWERNILPFLKPLKRAEKPVRIHFEWHEPNMKRDVDNVAFAKKFILDALVISGVLENDSPRFVKGFSDEFIYGDEGVVIMIEEVQSESEAENP